ncbi:MAG TPA: hypothetical protein VIL20_05510 [Sandaracinaceae bacterium]
MTQVENTADPTLAGADRDAVDPELLALPAPPQGRRIATLAVMALVVVAAMALAVSLRHDLAYFFSSGPTVDLGDVRSLDPARLTANSHVRVQGTPMLSRAVRYRRVLTGGEYVVFPLAGQRTVYVQVEDREDAIARNEFSGRLVTFSQLGGRMDAVRGYLGREMGLPVSGDSFVLLADEGPGSYAWAFMLALLCVLVVLVDVLLLLRWFRPLPRVEDRAKEPAVVG